MKNRLKKIQLPIKLLVVLLLIWFVRGTILSGLEKLQEHPLQISPGWLFAGGGLYLAGLFFAGAFWLRTLRQLGQEPRWYETLRAYYIGHLGKYVPGKALVVLIRAGLIRSRRVEMGIAAASVFFETLTMMSVGAFWAAAILAIYYRHHPLLALVAVGLMVGAGLPILPPIFRRLVRLTRVGRSDPLAAAKIDRLGWRLLVEGFLLMTATWLLLAASYWAVLQGMGVENLNRWESIPLLLAAVSLAMVAGFLSLIPGGAVVRELVLTELMVPRFGSAVALASAVLLRLVWLGAELALSAILYPLGRRSDQKNNTPIDQNR